MTEQKRYRGPVLNRRVLISTIAPHSGGVPQMTRFVAECLEERGFIPIVAYYEPYSLSPHLSVPSFKLLQRRVSKKAGADINGCEAYAIGAWLPELEFTHYMPTKLWKEMMRTCICHISVSGSCIAALPYVLTARSFLAWVATPWHEDRKDRVKDFPLLRRQLDRMVNARIISQLEKRILNRGTILALSDYTKKKLQSVVSNKRDYAVLSMPVNLQLFKPDSNEVVIGRIGFTGRFCDPRKNIDLLLRAVNICAASGLAVTLELVGDEPDAALLALIKNLNLQSVVEFVPQLRHEQLARRLRCIDVFVIPSFQEGLCISALEAMASGCPVVSTRCGGPEEFVIDGETGRVVDFEPNDMASAIMELVSDRALRESAALRARAYIEQRYSPAMAKRVFWDHFDATFSQASPISDTALGNR